MSAGRKKISNKKDWNTPPKYIEKVKNVLGEIELDPCSNDLSMVGAKTEFILPIDGLSMEWDYVTIFVNPPYGRDMERGTTIKNWITKINNTHIKYGSEILCLIPVATNTTHYKDIIFKDSTGLCFLEDSRLKFMIDGELSKKGAPMSCAMIYWGNNYNKFENIFKDTGMCFKINI